MLADIEQNAQLPHKVSHLAVNGWDLLSKISGGTTVGKVLDMLLNYVLQSPTLNTKEHLMQLVEEKYGKN